MEGCRKLEMLVNLEMVMLDTSLSSLLQITQRLKVRFTACLPWIIQNLSLGVVSVVWTELSFTDWWVWWIYISTNGWCEGNKIGFLVSNYCKLAWFILPWHLSTWSPSRNEVNWSTLRGLLFVLFEDNWSCLRKSSLVRCKSKEFLIVSVLWHSVQPYSQNRLLLPQLHLFLLLKIYWCYWWMVTRMTSLSTDDQDHWIDHTW